MELKHPKRNKHKPYRHHSSPPHSLLAAARCNSCLLHAQPGCSRLCRIATHDPRTAHVAITVCSKSFQGIQGRSMAVASADTIPGLVCISA